MELTSAILRLLDSDLDHVMETMEGALELVGSNPWMGNGGRKRQRVRGG